MIFSLLLDKQINYLRLAPALTLLLIGQTAWSQGARPPAPVVVVSAERTWLAPTVAVPGTVISRNDAVLAAEVAGRVSWIAEVGTIVSQGDPVARLEDTRIALQKDEAIGLVDKQKARLTYLEPEVERLRKLRLENNAAASLLDQTVSDLQVARAELRIAEAQLAQIQDQLAKTVIRAPFSGIVSERMSSLGETLAVGSLVARLVDPSTIEVVARAPLRSAGFLQQSSIVQVQSDRMTEKAPVRAIVPFGAPESHMFEMRLDVSPDHWVVGEGVQVSIPTAEAREVLAVPRDALVLRREGASVFRVNEEQVVEQISVLAGAGDGDMVEISGELSAGDVVVIRGAERLRGGQKVSILGAREPGAAESAAAN